MRAQAATPQGDRVCNYRTIAVTHSSAFTIGGAPEPATLARVALGGLGALLRRRRK